MKWRTSPLALPTQLSAVKICKEKKQYSIWSSFICSCTDKDQVKSESVNPFVFPHPHSLVSHQSNCIAITGPVYMVNLGVEVGLPLCKEEQNRCQHGFMRWAIIVIGFTLICECIDTGLLQ